MINQTFELLIILLFICGHVQPDGPILICLNEHSDLVQEQNISDDNVCTSNHHENLCSMMNQNDHQVLKSNKTIDIIVDTDIGQFPDDHTAFSILHRLANNGLVNILATVGSTQYEGIAMAIDVINTYFGRANIPIGVTKDPNAYSDPQGSQNWTEMARKIFPHKVKKNNDVEDSVVVYRRTLASVSDNSVVILQIGHFTNLANLLESKPDQFSSLNGHQLVTKKVKEVVTMAGNFPQGKEWNIEMDIGSAKKFASGWPTKVTFAGFEVADMVNCALKYQEMNLEQAIASHNPMALAVYYGYQQYGNYNGCFDAVAALVSVQDYTTSLYCAVPGHITILSDGSNRWQLDNANATIDRQQYIKLRFGTQAAKVNKIISKQINNYLPNL